MNLRVLMPYMKNQPNLPFCVPSNITVPSWGVLIGSCLSLSIAFFAQAAQAETLTQNQEIYKTFEGNEKKGTLLDVSNPMELMNLLRRATAMDNATNPSDAIDQALQSLEIEESEESY